MLFDLSRRLCRLSSFERTWPYGEAQRSTPNPCQGAALSPCEPWPLRPLSRGWCEPCLTHTIPVTTEDLETSVLNCTGWRSVPTNSLAEGSKGGQERGSECAGMGLHLAQVDWEGAVYLWALEVHQRGVEGRPRPPLLLSSLSSQKQLKRSCLLASRGERLC